MMPGRESAPSVLLQQSPRSLLRFAQPTAILEAREAGAVLPLLEEADAALAHGRWVAGFVGYEAAQAFGLATHEHDAQAPPLVWLGVFERPQVCRLHLPAAGTGTALVGHPALDAGRHRAILAGLQEQIAAGHTYQVNFTFPLTARLEEEPSALFMRLLAVQRPRYAAFVDLGRFAIASASPELFFLRDASGNLTMRPMKGTAARGRTPAEDEQRASALRRSEKERAENLMVVDMIRNDLGRVAETGSVRVSRLFEVERYPTLLQMTSTVQARSREPLSRIMAALFPCASVTGPPKARTMEILKRNEDVPRGVYTGAIGWAAPGGRARFSVAIRTAVADRTRGSLVFGVGSGVVADSNPTREYAECLLKGRVLQERPFALVETMAFEPQGGYRHLAGHLLRLRASAAHFGFRFGRSVERALHDLASTLDGPSRVRLLLQADGRVETQTGPLPSPKERPLRVGLAAEPVDSASIWLYHKTTHRDAYERARASRPDCDEVLLWNERGEITESPIANVAIETADGRLTPPATCGLLPGVERGRLLAAHALREGIVRCSELRPGTHLWLVSSLRGMREAVFLGG